MSSTLIMDIMMERMQRQTLVDLVQLPYLRAAPTGQDIVRILQGLESSTMEGLRLPALHLSQLEALQVCLTVNPSVRMVSVQDLCSNMAYTYFCRAMESHEIHQVAIGRADRVITKDVSIVACNALANLLENTRTIEQLSLTSLRLCRPEIVANGISKNQTLRAITLRNIQMDDISIFVRALECIPLESLSLEDIEIDTDDVNVDDYSCSQQSAIEDSNPWLYLPHTLRKLCRTECSLCTPEVKALCDGLVDLPQLFHLTLSMCDLLPAAATCLRDLITSSRSLVDVNLEQNLLGNSGAAALLPCQCKCPQKPLTLNLQSNSICDVTQLFNACQSFHSLDLSDNPLGPSIPAMVAHETTTSRLKKVHLGGCCLTDNEIVSLCKVVPASVVELGLANNVVHQSGAEAIRRLLESTHGILSLDLSSCHIDDVTIGQLLPNMEGSSPQSGGLRELYLAFNKIENDGMISIARYLRQRQCQLRTLNLQFNEFDDAGLRYIESALSERNMSLCYFYFWSNNHHFMSAAQAASSNSLERRIDNWLALNQAGRCALPVMSDGSKPKAYWAPILSHADHVYGVSGLFYLLKNRPDLIWDRSAQ